MEVLNIIKIGGSVITSEHADGMFHADAAKKIAKNVPPKSVLIHGSGLYGKPPAIEHGYLDGMVKKDRIGAVLYVRQKLSALNALFVDTLLGSGTAAFGVSASIIFFQRGGTLLFTGHGIMEGCLKRGVVPVIYSDFIFYRDDRLRVLSSDEIVYALAKKYRPRNTVFATNVEGVFMPGRTSGPIFDTIDAPALSRKCKGIVKDPLDVSGGMYDKLWYAVRAASYSPRCIILNGYKSERIKRFCRGARVAGTMIVGKAARRG